MRYIYERTRHCVSHLRGRADGKEVRHLRGWCGYRGTGAHTDHIVATATMVGERPWTGARRMALNTCSVCPRTNLEPRSSLRPRGARRRAMVTWSGRDYAETRYAPILVASPPRRGAHRATRKGLDIRYVVTSIARCPAVALWRHLLRRGQAENLIKRHKSQLASDRTSCRSPLANQMRLICTPPPIG